MVSCWLVAAFQIGCGGKLAIESTSSTSPQLTSQIITNWSNSSPSTSVTAVIPNSSYANSECLLTDPNLEAFNIRSGASIFGVPGTFSGGFASHTASNAPRDPGSQVNIYATTQTISNQLSLYDETTTYASTNLPTTGGYDYRDIPDQNTDDEGNLGTTCGYAPRPTSDCGTAQSTIAARVSDCASKNPSASTWNGASRCNGDQSVWNLVTRDGANEEVWQDQRTGLLWSSIVSSGTNWCEASGNTQNAPVTFSGAYNTSAGTPIVGNGTIGSITGGASSVAENINITFSSATSFTVSGTNCGGGAISSGGLTTTAGSNVTWSRSGYCSFTITQGSQNFASGDTFVVASMDASTYSCAPGAASGLQPASPISYCAEAAGLNPPSGENWSGGIYLAAKGLMGANSTPSVRWRLPTIHDYEQAELDGIRFILPDMGAGGSTRPIIDTSPGSSNYEWASTVFSGARSNSWYYVSWGGWVYFTSPRNTIYWARCVGR